MDTGTGLAVIIPLPNSGCEQSLPNVVLSKYGGRKPYYFV